MNASAPGSILIIFNSPEPTVKSSAHARPLDFWGSLMTPIGPGVRIPMPAHQATRMTHFLPVMRSLALGISIIFSPLLFAQSEAPQQFADAKIAAALKQVSPERIRA